MPTWIEKHRGDITFLVSILAAVALITVGLITGNESTLLLGAGALGIPAMGKVVAK